jgi:hypothetical protein
MHEHGHGGSGGHEHGHGGPGHNRAGRGVAQWQTPHRPHDPPRVEDGAAEPDFDLVEASFVEGFATASDPTSFLRLAGVPFTAAGADGARLCLLRVELDQVCDVGAVTPHLGGASYRYDPLPARLVARRRRLRLVYHDGAALRSLSLAEARALRPIALEPDQSKHK